MLSTRDLIRLVVESGGRVGKLDRDASHGLVDEFAGQEIDINAREILVSCLVKCPGAVRISPTVPCAWIARADALVEACERALTLLERAQDKSNSKFLARVMIGSPIPMGDNAEFVEEQTALHHQRVLISRLHTHLLTIRSRR